ncbi:GNAT family N-acetyltransferase [Gordonia sp. (in: high G+C Gram-positive bacteria)]|uniref:GNAT family N-acetyltransferase n=1 Tax=Gordonia sp. (in: high G+C Gram-positive bacteria) TaxID=84139 RepID=UPI0039E29F1E
MTSTLRTERLILRIPCESDVDAVFHACQDPDIQRFTLVPVPYRRSDAEHFVRVTATSPDSVTRVVTTASGRFVGCVGVALRSEDVGSLGYWCAPGQRGRGYLTEALAAVLDDAFDQGGLGLGVLEWSALPENVASARLAARLGFRFTGVRVDRGGGRDEEVVTAVLRATDERVPQHWPPLSGG